MNLAILQARMSSSRLPGKVMKPIQGRPMIGRQLDRLRRARRIDKLIVATSLEPSDDPLAAFCIGENAPVYRGAFADVLSRFREAINALGPADHIIRLTADCPLVDWTVVDACIELHLSQETDFTTNAMKRSFPDGLDVEVMSAATFQKLDCESIDADAREHVTSIVYRYPERFSIAHLVQPLNLGDLRWTVDTEADFQFIKAIFEALLDTKPDFLEGDVLKLLLERPDIASIANLTRSKVPGVRTR